MNNNYLKPIARVSAVLLTTVGLAATASAQSRGITVYSDIEFSGNADTFTQAMPDLRSVGMNDTISSIEVRRGEVWEVCSDINYRGRCREISGTVADLRNMSMNDQISSMRRVNGAVSNNPGFGNNRRSGNRFSEAIVYTNANYSGRRLDISCDTPDLRSMGVNDQISSITIPNGEAWEVCVDIDYGNDCRVFTNSVPDLSQFGMNDRISSIRPAYNSARSNRSGSNAQSTLTFYNRPNYRGNSRTMTRESNTDFIARQGSIQVNGRGVWRVCDDRGICATVDRDVPNIADLGLSDRITSVRPLTTSEYRRTR